MSTTAKAETDKTALFGDSAEAATTATAAPETTVPVTETTTPVTAAADTDLPEVPEVDNSDAGSEFNEEEEAPLPSEETSTAAEVLAPETPSTSVVKVNETPPPAAATEDENSNEEVVPLADSEMAMLNGEEETTDAPAPVPDADATAAPEGDGDFAKEEQEEAIPYADLPFFLNEETTFNYGDMCPVCFHAMTKEDMDDNMLANLLPCGHTLHVVCCDSLRKSMPTGSKTFNCPECSKPVAHAVTTTHTLGEQMEFKNQQGIIDSDEEEEEEETDTEDEDEEAEMDKEEEEPVAEVPVAEEAVAEEEDEIVSATPPKAKSEPKKSRHTKKKKVEKPHQRRTKLFSKKHKKLAKNK